MAKTKITAPIASRTRSKKNQTPMKIHRLMDCHVRLTRLTTQQIMGAVVNDLTNIEKKPLQRTYNLRNAKKEKIIAPKKKGKKNTTSNTISKIAPTCDMMTATRLWTYLKKENTIKPCKDLCCMAKMRSFSPWPSVVLEVKGKTTSVYFFGEGTTGTVQTDEIVPFEKCSVLARKLIGTKDYHRALRELEISLSVPLSNSITRI